MSAKEKLSDVEFKEMLDLLNRYTEYNLDQWARWKFETKYSTMFVNISMYASPPGSEESYDDVTHILSMGQRK